MLDFSWLAAEAQKIHSVFEGSFYLFCTVLLIIGVALEYFKIPLGETPLFSILISRAVYAVLLLVSFKEITNMIADITDALSNEIGGLNNFKYVLAKASDHLDKMSWSLVNVKKLAITLISFISFLLLYISVYLAEAIFLYTWTLLYIFSPVLIALYILPATASATRGLFKSLFLVSSWKIVGSVLATLLWSAAMIDLEKLNSSTSFLTIVIFNLMLALSLLFVPIISKALFTGGLESAAGKISGAAIAATSLVGAKSTLVYSKAQAITKPVRNKVLDGLNSSFEKRKNSQKMKSIN